LGAGRSVLVTVEGPSERLHGAETSCGRGRWTEHTADIVQISLSGLIYTT